MIINHENNIILPNGIKAFDLRSEHTNLCAFGQKGKMIVECPARFGGGRFSCRSIGAFSFFNENAYVRYVGNIGRFCMIGPWVTIGMVEHSTKSISSHILFCGQDVDHFMEFCDLKKDDVVIKANEDALYRERKK